MWDAGFERIRARLHDRRLSYQRVFLTDATQRPARWWTLDWWRGGGQVSAPAEVVMRDLAQYCYAGKPTLKVSRVTQQSDALAMAFAEGRRDVFNRIVAMCNLTADQIDRIAHQRSIENE